MMQKRPSLKKELAEGLTDFGISLLVIVGLGGMMALFSLPFWIWAIFTAEDLFIVWLSVGLILLTPFGVLLLWFMKQSPPPKVPTEYWPNLN